MQRSRQPGQLRGLKRQTHSKLMRAHPQQTSEEWTGAGLCETSLSCTGLEQACQHVETHLHTRSRISIHEQHSILEPCSTFSVLQSELGYCRLDDGAACKLRIISDQSNAQHLGNVFFGIQGYTEHLKHGGCNSY